MGVPPENVRDPGPPAAASWDNLIIPEEIKEKLESACRVLCNAEAYQAKGVAVPNILLYGPPGTGKTQIARTIANESGLAFTVASTADLKGQFLGQSAEKVRQVFTQARSMAPGILFIDDLESVATKRGSPRADSYVNEIVSQMLQEMDGVRRDASRVTVIAATNQPEEVDDAIKARFGLQIAIPLADESARRQILKQLLSRSVLAPGLDADQLAAEIAQLTPGKSGRDLTTLVNRANQRAVLRSTSAGAVTLTREDLLAELSPAKTAQPAQVQTAQAQPTQVQPTQVQPVQWKPVEVKAGQGPTEGLAENVASALCYVLGWVSGLIFFLIDKRPTVRFHAAQSMVVFGGLHILYFLLVRLLFASYFAFSLAALLLEVAQLGAFVLWVVLIVKAYQGERFQVPVAAEFAEKIAAQ
jgi:AAA+ superfamily predicted ATPase/uncharacterized membrane protein